MQPSHYVRGRQAVSADQLVRPGIPHEEMHVVPFELVNIELLACALASRTKRDLAKPAEFVQHIRYMDRSRHVHFEITGTPQQTASRQTGDLGCHVPSWHSGRNRLMSLPFASRQGCSGLRLKSLASSKKMGPPAEIIRLFPRSRHRQQFLSTD